MISTRNQKFNEGDIEIIVVDSSSPDKTRTIAEKYADRVINIEERGVSNARNVGAQKAKGQVLIFLDGDTVLESNAISEIFDTFLDSNVVYVSGTVEGFEKLGGHVDFFKTIHYNIMNRVASITAYFGFPFFPTVFCSCRRSVFKATGGFDEGLAIAEDITFSLKMGRIGKCLVNRKAKAYTSMRRIKKNGLLKNYFSYFNNYFKVFILKQKPWIKEFPHTIEI